MANDRIFKRNLGSLDERYFRWLYAKVGDALDKNPRNTHWLLCEYLFNRKFIWSVDNDENRALDGKYLREMYLRYDRTAPKNAFLFSDENDCSMLEMLIALSERAWYEADDVELGEDGVRIWFWRMLFNLDLAQYTDDINFEAFEDSIESIVDRLIFRNYSRTGEGGLFPLKHAHLDQRKVEIWYQLSSYIIENSELIDY